MDIEDIGREPTCTFGVRRATDSEVVGPIKPKNVQYGFWVPVSTVTADGSVTPMPLLTLNFNKYHSSLPNWHGVIEVFLASETGHAMTKVYRALDVAISGKLKTVQLGLSAVFRGECDGDIISCSDVREEPHSASQSKSDFRVDEVLE